MPVRHDFVPKYPARIDRFMRVLRPVKMGRDMRSLALAGPATEVAPHSCAAPNSARWFALIISSGFAIRLYLALTNYCISGDGAAYLRMAHDFDSGRWRAPLGGVFSPLYPLLIAIAHYPISDREMAGNLVSVLMGTGAIVSIYMLMREVFESHQVSLGAAALMAIHPDMAAYSASVRTEAGYIFLTTLAAWMLLRSVKRERIVDAAWAGTVAGVAYLYRTEAIGLIVLGAIFPLAAAIIWRAISPRSALALGAAFLSIAAIFVSSYVLALHDATGRWSFGREFTAAMMFGMGSAAHNSAEWRHLGFNAHISVLSAISHHPWLFLSKVPGDFAGSLYGFVQSIGALVFILLLAGLWARGRTVLTNYGEAFLAGIVIFYFCGFTLSYTGARFMSHLIPYTFGWVIPGLEKFSTSLRKLAQHRGLTIPLFAPAALAALVLLPQTLWPIGYDQRGMRYAGEMIAASNPSGEAVAANDGRVAWYAHAKFVALPESAPDGICTWLELHSVGYALISDHDEHRLGISSQTTCLERIAHYPRYGAEYYDLYRLRGLEGSR